MFEKLHGFQSRSDKPATQFRRPRPLRFESLEGRDLMAGQIFQQIPVDLSDLDQLTLELVNRARANPLAEASRQGIGLNDGLPSTTFISSAPKQPLSPDTRLTLAAKRHSQDMIDRDYFAHDAKDPPPNGKTPFDRADNVGFGPFVAENIAFTSTNGRTQLDSAIELHNNLFKSTTGHRSNILNEEYNVLGVGVVAGDYTQPVDLGEQTFPSVFTTEVFGNTETEVQQLQDGFITGVVYRDTLVDDDFFSIGEAVADVWIEARSASGDVFGTASGRSGGYRIAVPNGVYSVAARVGSQSVNLGNVTIADKNVKLDVMTDRIPAEPVYDLDANRDGMLSALDALVVINFLNLNVPVSALPQESQVSYDINRNTIIEPLDVLIVINAINRQSGEGEQQNIDTPLQFSDPYQLHLIESSSTMDPESEISFDKKFRKQIGRLRTKP
jgi:hypothetical protein